MSKKPKPKQRPAPDDPAQYKRFVETAKEVGADDNDEVLEQALTKIAKAQSPKLV